MKKYEFTGEVKVLANGVLVRQIRALMDFGKVVAGELGGWIEKEENLSHDMLCWVAGNAAVYGNAKVSENAYIWGNAHVYERASISENAQVYGFARVHGKSKIHGNSHVFGHAHVLYLSFVYGNAMVHGYSVVNGGCVYGNADVEENAFIDQGAEVTGETHVYGNCSILRGVNIWGHADLYKKNHIQCIDFHAGRDPIIGERIINLTFYRNDRNKMSVKSGCVNISKEEFLKFASTKYDGITFGRLKKFVEDAEDRMFRKESDIEADISLLESGYLKLKEQTMRFLRNIGKDFVIKLLAEIFSEYGTLNINDKNELDKVSEHMSQVVAKKCAKTLITDITLTVMNYNHSIYAELYAKLCDGDKFENSICLGSEDDNLVKMANYID